MVLGMYCDICTCSSNVRYCAPKAAQYHGLELVCGYIRVQTQQPINIFATNAVFLHIAVVFVFGIKNL